MVDYSARPLYTYIILLKSEEFFGTTLLFEPSFALLPNLAIV